jgi:hypothetical protein
VSKLAAVVTPFVSLTTIMDHIALAKHARQEDFDADEILAICKNQRGKLLNLLRSET